MGIPIQDCKVSVHPHSVAEDDDKVLVQYHVFPGTLSVVAHASLNGFELAVSTSPCVDPKVFDRAVGEHYAGQKVRQLANNKIWEMKGIALRQRLIDYAHLTSKEFEEKFPGQYRINPPESAVYKAPTLPLTN